PGPRTRDGARSDCGREGYREGRVPVPFARGSASPGDSVEVRTPCPNVSPTATDLPDDPGGTSRYEEWCYPFLVKYRHHGYKDDEYDRERKRAPQPKKQDDGMPPRSRLAEKRMATLVFRCHNCGRQAAAPEEIARDEKCAGCGM